MLLGAQELSGPRLGAGPAGLQAFCVLAVGVVQAVMGIGLGSGDAFGVGEVKHGALAHHVVMLGVGAQAAAKDLLGEQGGELAGAGEAHGPGPAHGAGADLPLAEQESPCLLQVGGRGFEHARQIPGEPGGVFVGKAKLHAARV